MNLVQRYRDWQHERRIQALGDACNLACRLGSKDVARGLWDDMGEAINARSPSQITRMEARMGIRARRSIKQRVMSNFLRGRIPAGFVTTTFRLLKLRSL